MGLNVRAVPKQVHLNTNVGCPWRNYSLGQQVKRKFLFCPETNADPFFGFNNKVNIEEDSLTTQESNLKEKGASQDFL